MFWSQGYFGRVCIVCFQLSYMALFPCLSMRIITFFFLLHRDENGYYVDMFDQPQTVPMSTYLVAFTIAELYYIETYYRNISVCMQYSFTCHQYLYHPKQHTVNWEIFASSIFYRTCSMIVIFTLCFSQFCW